MLTQLKAQVRDVWGVEDVDRQLKRYGAEHFRSALQKLQDLDHESLDNHSGLLIKTVRDKAIQYYGDRGVNPSLLRKMPGGDQDEPPFVAPSRSVPWHPLLGPAVDLNFVQPDWNQTQVRLPDPDPLPLLSKV